ncbi:hypothetical protein PSFL111601_08910 [Pseudomonas floridensis]
MTAPIKRDAMQFICGCCGHIASLVSVTASKRQIVEKQLPDPIGNVRSKH